MSRNIIIFIIGISFLFCSCKSIAPKYNYTELAKASLKLGVDIDYRDNQKLYLEAAKWLGAPYKYGGRSLSGVDCSGLSRAIYLNVYNISLSRSADEQYRKDCRRVSKRKLKEGDLVFFKGSRRSRKANHVGVYLKEGKFIHASTSSGVIISNLNEYYYKNNWLSGGRID